VPVVFRACTEKRLAISDLDVDEVMGSI
jgi:hypothetical protein